MTEDDRSGSLRSNGMVASPWNKARGNVDGVDLLDVALGALQQMTLDEREAFIDWYVVGDPDPEIARRLNLSQGRIQQLKQRARSRVYAHLEPNVAVAA